jgi:HEAT repeat protein
VERLPRVYHDVCPQLQTVMVHMAYVPYAAPKEDERPERVAELIERAAGWPALVRAGQIRCKQFLTAHRDAVEGLAREGLGAESRRDRLWALDVIGELRLIRLFDDVISALNGPEPIYAAQALRALDDPRAISPLIERFPEDPTQFFEVLRTLQRNRPPHPLLLGLVKAKDGTARWRATYALAESRDPTLVRLVPGLVADPVPEVRRQAGYLAISFDEPDYRRARPSITPLLSDADDSVRADVAVAMASRGDRTSAPVLLALVEREETLEPWRQSNVVQAIHTLTSSYFGLTPGTPSAAAVRRKALTDFARWIEEHPPDR